MTYNLHLILFTECYKTIRVVKVKLSLLRLQKHAFHAVFGDNGVELLFDNCYSLSVPFPYLIKIEGSTYKKVIFKCLFQGQ
ncbi:hypothetical protein D3C73_691300 [compost metagenome]